MKVGDLVTILYEKKAYCIIVAKGGPSSFQVMHPSGNIRSIPRLELIDVNQEENRYV